MPGVVRPMLHWHTRKIEPPLETIDLSSPLNGLTAAATGTTG
jgi:hypothetical protein